MEKKEFRPYDGEQLPLIDFTQPDLQRKKFKVLSDLISQLFEQRQFFSDFSNAIVSFLHVFDRTGTVDVFSGLPDIPFSHAGREIQHILREEFIREGDHE